MTDEYEYTRNLDLLGDWLDAKGYTEEAGLITRSMDYMHKQAARITELEAALKPFARAFERAENWDAGPNRGDLREAYKALGGEGWQFRAPIRENKEPDIMDRMYLIGVEYGEKKARAALGEKECLTKTF